MVYKDINELGKAGFEGTAWLVTVIVFNEWIDGDVGYNECVYWDDGEDLHPFEGVFTDYQEARAHAASFDADMAMWAHTHGIGTEYQHVSVDVVQFDFDGEMSEGDTRCMFEWRDGKDLEVIEFDEKWDQILPVMEGVA